MRNATSFLTTGHSTLSFFIREIAFGLAPPFNSSLTAFGTFLGFGDGYTLTLNLVSMDTEQTSDCQNKSIQPVLSYCEGLKADCAVFFLWTKTVRSAATANEMK